MLRIAALTAIVATAAGNSNTPVYPKAVHHVKKTTPGLPTASLGVFFDKKCRKFPDLVVETPPGACTPFPATSVYFQILCGEQVPVAVPKKGKKAKKDDSSSSSSEAGARRLADDSSSNTDSSSSSADDSSKDSSSSSGAPKDDSSSSSSHAVSKKHKAKRVKPSHTPVALRLCKDKFCKHCKKVLVTKTNTCTALPTKTYYGRALNNVPSTSPSSKLGFCAFVAKCPAAPAPAH